MAGSAINLGFEYIKSSNKSKILIVLDSIISIVVLIIVRRRANHCPSVQPIPVPGVSLAERLQVAHLETYGAQTITHY